MGGGVIIFLLLNSQKKMPNFFKLLSAVVALVALVAPISAADSTLLRSKSGRVSLLSPLLSLGYSTTTTSTTTTTTKPQEAPVSATMEARVANLEASNANLEASNAKANEKLGVLAKVIDKERERERERIERLKTYRVDSE